MELGNDSLRYSASVGAQQGSPKMQALKDRVVALLTAIDSKLIEGDYPRKAATWRELGTALVDAMKTNEGINTTLLRRSV